MAELREQKDLTCPDCEGTLFIAVVAVRHNTGGGTVYPPRGHQCLGCQRLLDVAEILRYEEEKQLERQLSSLQERRRQVQRPPKNAAPATSTTPKS